MTVNLYHVINFKGVWSLKLKISEKFCILSTKKYFRKFPKHRKATFDGWYDRACSAVQTHWKRFPKRNCTLVLRHKRKYLLKFGNFVIWILGSRICHFCSIEFWIIPMTNDLYPLPVWESIKPTPCHLFF